MLKKILIALGVVIVAFLAYAATRPDSYTVQREAVISAPAAVVFDQLDDFRSFAQWSPWEKLDPNMTKAFSGPESGVGASYAWQGNDQVGKGRMTIEESVPGRKVGINLEFVKPMASTATCALTLAATPAGSIVTWSMDGNHNFMGKAFGMFVDMDNMLGTDIEKGLARLKTAAEGTKK